METQAEGAINAPFGGGGSNLFTYPTQVIAQAQGTTNPYSTGSPHLGSPSPNFNLNDTTVGGGANVAFQVADWASGLQPVATNGALVDWLIAGTYAFTNLTDTSPSVNETTGTPLFFDPDGTSQANGWDVLAVNNLVNDTGGGRPGQHGRG